MPEQILQVTPDSSELKDGPKWIEALPARTYDTPFYGDVEVTQEKLNNFIKNFKDGVRGVDIALDFEHGFDSAKGNKAAGWFKDFKIEPSSADPAVPALYALVDFTEEAKKDIEDGHWKYVSMEWEDIHKDTDGNKYSDVIIGGGLTNRPVAKKMMPINFSELAEVKELEHSEPGSGNPPEPRKEGDNSDDPAVTEGWRRFSPPDQEATPPVTSNSAKGGKRMAGGEYVFAETQAQELLRTLELPVDAAPDAILEAVKGNVGELTTMRESVDKETEEKLFAEKYPAYWAEHNRLMERDRMNSAKAFSEGVKTVRKAVGNGLIDTNQVLSAGAQNKIAEMHTKFSEGTATIEDFEECIKTITNGGLVQMGEIGSGTKEDDVPEVDTSSATGVAQARKIFAEIVGKLQKDNEGMSLEDAMEQAAKKHPDLAQAYRQTVPA